MKLILALAVVLAVAAQAPTKPEREAKPVAATFNATSEDVPRDDNLFCVYSPSYPNRYYYRLDFTDPRSQDQYASGWNLLNGRRIGPVYTVYDNRAGKFRMTTLITGSIVTVEWYAGMSTAVFISANPSLPAGWFGSPMTIQWLGC
mmetsp:Transcript_3033/g.3608  ORF Transcript_3033/g.3608 Transcript_3033/m.3608 type:complete len:146 (-) Transcript_3033:85-522(-)|eukprot:CAMPEP_0205822500 /NCGR_PEP_ID=MMETSP0206-20130828/12742_1 /ASSEMBLY_ACC=CAM_ASM_000279 /TAXON_ID=36767 /ORGANISM="Euplotes focardii, Strain TN1" /LENGTH=145 /DNA_ID=CAMNT_0053118815 /DNA_START=28 /DNA_END=465 /DNA_ORIENTATION=+